MRLLVATPFLPHAAATHGGGVYLHALFAAMAQHAELALVSFVTTAELEAGACPAPGWVRSDLVVRATLDDRQGLRRLGSRLRTLSRFVFSGVPVVASKFESAAMRRVLTATAAEFRPDACLVEFGLMARYLPALAGRHRVLTDHEACAAVPANVLPGGVGQARDRRLWQRTYDRFYPRAEQLQALNEPDAATLAARFGRAVAVRPACVEVPRGAVNPAAAPPRVLFLGDFSHHPNPEAAHWLVAGIWPEVRRAVPQAELWLVGKNAAADVRGLDAVQHGVVFRGFEPDLAGTLAAARCLVAPLRSGAGSRIKVLTALSHGLPVVATELGARGVDATAPALCREEKAAGLAACLIRWLTNPVAVEAAAIEARSWALRSISPDAVARRQLALLRQGR